MNALKIADECLTTEAWSRVARLRLGVYLRLLQEAEWPEGHSFDMWRYENANDLPHPGEIYKLTAVARTYTELGLIVVGEGDIPTIDADPLVAHTPIYKLYALWRHVTAENVYSLLHTAQTFTSRKAFEAWVKATFGGEERVTEGKVQHTVTATGWQLRRLPLSEMALQDGISLNDFGYYVVRIEEV